MEVAFIGQEGSTRTNYVFSSGSANRIYGILVA
jgi:hypothetical protein